MDGGLTFMNNYLISGHKRWLFLVKSGQYAHMMNQTTANLEKQHLYLCTCTTYCNFKHFKFVNTKFTDCYTIHDFAKQILFLHRSFAMQNFQTKSFPLIGCLLSSIQDNTGTPNKQPVKVSAPFTLIEKS